ncbi:hypothetical protein [Flagellimonas sp.]
MYADTSFPSEILNNKYHSRCIGTIFRIKTKGPFHLEQAFFLNNM